MIRLSGFIAAVFLSVVCLLGAATMVETRNSPSSDEPDEMWRQVEQAKKQGKPRTAAKILQKIYQSAVDEKDFVEATKAYCIRARIEGQINQPEQPYIIRKLQAEVPNLPAEMKPVMQVIQADWFLQYYYQNRWKFAKRSQTGQAPSEDFETWDLPRLLSEIDNLLTQALTESEMLKRIPIEKYNRLLTEGTISDLHRPTLYDFLANRAIEFYALDEQIVRRQNAFEITADSPIFSSTDDFLAWVPKTPDDASALLKSVKLYQDLIRFHADDADPTARYDVDLHRIHFGYRHSVGSEKIARYHAALQRFSDRNSKHELSTLAIALMAESLQNENELADAHRAATVGMNRFPNSHGGKRCFNLVKQIERPSIAVETEQIWNQAQPEFRVEYKNVDQIHFRLIPFDYRKWNWGSINRPSRLSSQQRKTIAKRDFVAQWSVQLPPTPDYQTKTKQLPANLDVKPGCYLLLSSYKKDFSANDNIVGITDIWVSDINVVSRTAGNGLLAGQVLNGITGQPISDAKVSIYQWQQAGRNSREAFVKSVLTDAQGLFSHPIPKRGYHQVFVEHDNQKMGYLEFQYARASRRGQGKTYEQTFLFTDRAIYRPGQTIKFKGICVASNIQTNQYNLITGRNIEISLFDANSQKVETKTFRSNDFGSFSGSFTAPRDRVTGSMFLQIGPDVKGYSEIRVEEYKRPKFAVEIDKPTQEAHLDRPVDVRVNAASYTGAPIDGAQVTWRVERTVQYPQWWYWRCWYAPPVLDTQEIANGTGTTSTDGKFTVTFPATPDRSIDRESQPVFIFKIHADVTDGAGETRSTTQTVRVGYTSLAAELNGDDWQTADQPVELQLTTKSLDSVGRSASGQLTIYRLKSPDKVERPRRLSRSRFSTETPTDLSDIRSWELGESIATQKIETNQDGIAKPKFELAAGAYKAVFESADSTGQPVTAELPLQVADLSSKKFPIRVANFFEAKSWSAQPGEEFVAIWGTGYESGRAFVEIEHRGKIVDSYWTPADQTQAPIKFNVEKKHRGGFHVRVTYVRENRAYIQTRRIVVPWSNKDLNIKWEHFVSKLTPGGRETWTAVITSPDAERQVAEMVAGMYDASLDAYQRHGWYNRIKSIFYRDSSRMSLRYFNQNQRLRNIANVKPKQIPGTYTYRRFRDDIASGSRLFGNGWESSRILRNRTRSLALESRSLSGSVGGIPVPALAAIADGDADLSKDKKLEDENADKSGFLSAGEVSPNGSGATSSIDLEQITARKNLDETAFFFPHLMTDDQGIVRIEFEVPEALTRWKFMGLAHDAKLRTGLLLDEITTSKDLMVQPNPPRFLREGDQLEFSVKITNRSDDRQTGNIRLTLSDANTDQNLDEKFANQDIQKTFDVPARESRTVFWKLTVPDYVGVLVWKAVGATNELSDGEEGLLPVLSKKILVVESLPLPIGGKESKTFSFDRLDLMKQSDTLKNQSLTVQMASNPSWYAVMALPYLMEYPHQCNEQVFNRLYANAIGQHIVSSDPRIERVFKQWQATDALDSPLEQNEDIRNVLIAEAPWLRAGKKESQARREIANLFDKNRLNNEVRRAANQLAQAQYSDGSWSWFPGGPANDFITLYITTGFGRLRHLGVQTDVSPAIESLKRLDFWIHNKWNRLKQDEQLNRKNLSPMVCLYLYGRSFFLKDKPISDQHRPAVDYFLGQAKQHWLGMGRMSQAHLAIGLKRFKDKTTPKSIMESLTERSQVEDELGRHWRESEDQWWWYRAPIETQALIIEAYDEVMGGEQEKIEQCKTWLLKQKQTQNWKTTKSTADSIYALLLRGTSQLASTELVEVALGGTKIEPENVQAGTGFYQQKFTGPEIKNDMKMIEVKKSDDGIAWGSVHWQYLEDVSKIEPFEGTPLKLKKTLFVKKNTPSGPVINPIKGSVSVGDEVVTRVELRVDRNMEYVHLKDQRGSGTEPVDVLSRYRQQDGLWYYQSTRDTASHFFIDYLPRGTYVFEYSVRVQHRGKYQSGIASLQCMYAPEFNSHSNSVSIDVQ